MIISVWSQSPLIIRIIIQYISYLSYTCIMYHIITLTVKCWGYIFWSSNVSYWKVTLRYFESTTRLTIRYNSVRKKFNTHACSSIAIYDLLFYLAIKKKPSMTAAAKLQTSILQKMYQYFWTEKDTDRKTRIESLACIYIYKGLVSLFFILYFPAYKYTITLKVKIYTLINVFIHVQEEIITIA